MRHVRVCHITTGGHSRHLRVALTNQSSADPPRPSFVFTLAATGTTGRKN
jgi:hypothetical protein